ncbi:protein kinase [Frankia sp. AiPa1]|uniref:protein kinase domain-containing protein n=1 Tax=Frankia sp. AiPa1 TaxID=573492 RepID=UPI00202B3F75|nr:protein kinase [Frankia sp. AiPa1]MCL9757729.1 protein kinase [Frankia sp. AiPa1]
MLGHGGFGVVHRATDELLQRPVAVKEVRLPVAETGLERDRARERVLREARAAGRLHHPGAVTVLDVIDDGDLPWIVMEYVEGQSLSDIIIDSGARPVEETCRIGISLAYALEAAHRLGIVHRDVKPSNVLVTADGQARLTDFGIAVSHGDPRLTNTGVVLGSPAYLPPERARGGAGGAAGDRWGLGAALFTVVEGCPPYAGGDPVAVVSALMRGERRPFRLAGPLAPLIDDLMAPHEANRPTLPAVRRRLRDIVQSFGDHSSARGGTRIHRSPRPSPPPAVSPAPTSPAPSPSGPPETTAAGKTAAVTRPAGTETTAATADAVVGVAADAGAKADVAGAMSGAGTTPARNDGTLPEQFHGMSAVRVTSPSPDGNPADTAGASGDIDESFPAKRGDRSGNSAPVPLVDTAENPQAVHRPGGAEDSDHPTIAAQAREKHIAAHGNRQPEQHINGEPAAPEDPIPAGEPEDPIPAGEIASQADRTSPADALADVAATGMVATLATVATAAAPLAPGGADLARTAAPSARARITRPVERLRQVDRTRALGGIPARARLIGRNALGHAAPATPATVRTPSPPPTPSSDPPSPGPVGPSSPPSDPPTRPSPEPEGSRQAAAGSAPGADLTPAGSPALRSDASPATTPATSPASGSTPAPGTSPAPVPRRARGAYRLIVLVSVLAALAAAVAVTILLLISRSGSPDGASSASPGAPSADRAAALRDPLATRSVPAVPPPGWASYTDPSAGWSVAYPTGWRPQPGPGGAGNVDFVDPASDSFLRVGSVRRANTSAIGAWQYNEASFVRSVQDYRRLRLAPSGGGDGTNQADWEFAYRRSDGVMVHVLNRGAIRNGHGYALYWHTREDHWLQDQPMMASLFGTFRPGP